MVYSNTTVDFDPFEEEELRKQAEEFKNYKQQEQAEQEAYKGTVQQEVNQQQTQGELTDPKTGKLKSSFETKDPKEFGPKENAQEATNAVLGGLGNIVNSVTAIPQKIVDPRFYTDISGEPYKPAWVPFGEDVNPMTKTVWGGLIKGVVEMGGLMALTRGGAKAGARIAPGPVKAPLNYIGSGPTMVKGQPLKNFKKQIAWGAAVGAPADFVSSNSTEANLARTLIRMRPDLEDYLEPLATHERMTPVQRSFYNLLEGLGIGPVMDVAGQGAVALVRGLRGAKPAAKAASAPTDPDFIARARELGNQKLEMKVEAGAARQAEMDFTRDPVKYKPWQSMNAEEKFEAKKAFAKRRGLNWGDDTDPALKRQESQDANETDVAMSRLEADPQGEKGFDGYINTGGESIQGRATSTTRSVLDSVESINQVKRDYGSQDGTPNNFIPENGLERINATPGGRPITQTDYMKRMVDNDPGFQIILDNLRANSRSVDSLMPEANRELAEVMAGRKKVFDLSDDEFDSLFVKTNEFEGNKYYTDLDQAKASMLSAILNREIRDFAMAAKSVEGQMDVMAKDGLMDLMLKRWVAIGRGIKESNFLRSIGLSNLRKLKGEQLTTEDMANIALRKDDVTAKLADIATDAQTSANIVRDAIAGDKTDDLLKLLLDAFSGNDKLSTFDDLDTFFRRKLWGYTDGDVVQQNALLRELGSMYVNSVLSGPKTPIRAAFGTGFVTYSRPVFSAIGAAINGDQRQLKASFAQIQGLFEATGDAWAVFRKQLKSNFEGGEIPDLGTIATRYNRTESDTDWEMLGNWVQNRGSDAEKAWYFSTDFLRGANRNVLLTWSSRVMNATDLAFHTIIGKQKARSEAFLKTLDTFEAAGKDITDAEFPAFMRNYEAAINDEIFDANGLLRDSFAKYVADEATMTKDLPVVAARFEKAFQSNALLRPFLLFARTGYNALELTAKHTPFLNNAIKEIHAVKTLPTGHPDLLRYGIRTADEHDAAKAIIRGRAAIGGMTIMSAVGMYLSGRLTGNGPQEKQLRDTWMQSGWQPRSIMLPTPTGPKWVSYDSLEPFNGFLAFVADVGDVSQQMGEEWTEKMLGSAWYLIQANITNRSFFFGLSQLSDVIGNSAPDTAEKFLGNLVNSQVPLSSMRNEIGRFFNPGMRELEAGFWDSIKNRNLWAGELADLPYRYDVLDGSPLRMWDVPTRMWNAVMPFQINPVASQTRQTLWRSLFDLKVSVNTMPGGDGEIPPTLKSKWQYLIGKQNVEAKLAKLFQSRQIQDSIMKMESDRDSGLPQYSSNDPMSYPHNEAIKKIFDDAKKIAFLELQRDAEASAILYKAKQDRLAANLRKKGRFNQAEQMQQLIQTPIK